MHKLISFFIAALITVSNEFVNGQQACTTYTGSLCAQYINFPVSLPAGTSVDDIETALNNDGLSVMASVIDAYPECINNYLAMVCIQSFPKCTSTTDSTPLYPCRSLCLSVSSTCFDLFKQLGQTQNLPDCSAHIPSLSINYPLDASQICVAYNYAVGGGGLVSVNNPFAASTTSTTITSGTSTAGSSATSSATTTYSSSSSSAVTCNTPLIHVPLANQTSAMTCVIECCLPCPILDTFYPVGTFENYFKVTDPFSYLSFILMVFMSASFTFLPSKNKKSARVLRMLFYSLTILSARTLFAAGPGGLRSIQCVDALTMSNQGNNGLCSAQAIWVMFGAYSGMLWYLALGINLMMRLVLKTEWLEDRQWILHFLTWPIAAAFCIAAYSVKGIAYLSLGNCYLSDQWADPIFFYPFTVITILAVISFLISSGYIAFCMFTSNIGNTGDSQSNLNDNTSTQSKLRQRVKDANTKAMKFWKLQWRTICFMGTNLSFFLGLMIIYYAELKNANSAAQGNWNNAWGNCMLKKSSNGTFIYNQDYCARNYAQGHMPSTSVLYFFDLLPFMPGLVTAMVFLPYNGIFTEWIRVLFGQNALLNLSPRNLLAVNSSPSNASNSKQKSNNNASSGVGGGGSVHSGMIKEAKPYESLSNNVQLMLLQRSSASKVGDVAAVEAGGGDVVDGENMKQGRLFDLFR